LVKNWQSVVQECIPLGTPTVDRTAGSPVLNGPACPTTDEGVLDANVLVQILHVICS
jgi:hypothetical protein